MPAYVKAVVPGGHTMEDFNTAEIEALVKGVLDKILIDGDHYFQGEIEGVVNVRMRGKNVSVGILPKKRQRRIYVKVRSKQKSIAVMCSLRVPDSVSMDLEVLHQKIFEMTNTKKPDKITEEPLEISIPEDGFASKQVVSSPDNHEAPVLQASEQARELRIGMEQRQALTEKKLQEIREFISPWLEQEAKLEQSLKLIKAELDRLVETETNCAEIDRLLMI